ncbi:MAG TPA: respiratory nitrate reductase subunit gamma [Holophagaceae bacterium]|nr:respiratory nitrate reductase subunit gamma [Holophagaceae bacterium]
MPASFLNTFLFVGLPYLMLALAIALSVLRFKVKPFTYSSLSSQFLENEQLYWGSNLWHWGILWVLGGHLLGFLVPSGVLAWNAHPVRLLILELSALIGGLLALFGVIALTVRRFSNPRVKAVTSKMDRVLLLLLLVQVATGVDTALRFRWGSSWYAASAVPYLRSLFLLAPKPQFILALTWGPRIHILNGFLILALIPFTRLVHFLVVPLPYLWRRPQVVIWNRREARG